MTQTIDRESTVTTWDEMYVEDCCNCGIRFAMPVALRKRRFKDGKTFWCPNGHNQHYTHKKSLEDQLLDSRDRIRREENNNVFLRDQLGASERSLAAQKGVTTRIKNRIFNGVCPCCKRSFQDLHKHMKGQHPDYASKE